MPVSKPNAPQHALRRWLKNEHRTQADFARDLGIEPTTLYKYLAGKVRPGRALMARIEEMTEGDVTEGDLIPIDHQKLSTFDFDGFWRGTVDPNFSAFVDKLTDAEASEFGWRLTRAQIRVAKSGKLAARFQSPS